MSLVDFMHQLQDQDNIVYSEAPEPSIRVIPPEKNCTKIIPPESTTVKPPTTIKLKIKQKNVEIKQNVQPQVEQPTNNIIKKPPINTENQTTTVQNTYEHKNEQQSVPETKHIQHELTDEEIFISTGTELSKKSIWMEYFEKAKRSRKSNAIVARMKIGKFTITPDNKVLLLPDYNVVGKDPDNIIKDKWF